MTVGEIYGCSPLSESDAPLTDPAMLHEAELVCGSGTASLAGGPMLAAGRARLRRDRPTYWWRAGLSPHCGRTSGDA